MYRLIKIMTLLILMAGWMAPVWAAPGSLNTWVQTSTNIQPGSNGNAFSFSPNYAVDQTVFAATYTGVYKSTDGGFTWQPTGLTKASSSLAFSPDFSSDQVLLAGTGQGVWVTRDGGDHWADISANLPGAARGILVVRFSPNYLQDHTFFVGTRDDGLYKAADVNAPNWTASGMNATNSRINSLVFSPGYASDQVLFAGAYTGTAGGGIYKSSNNGDSWITIENWDPEPVHRNVTALAISPNYQNDQTLFVGLYAAGVYRSTDSGNNWNFLSGLGNQYIQSLTISPGYAVDGTVFAGEEGDGCYLTSDGGTSWRTFNTGFDGDKSILALAIPPNQTGQPFNLFAGMFGDRVWQLLYQNVLTKVYLPLVIR